jgi:FtsZ-interacting cell division protein YlmF
MEIRAIKTSGLITNVANRIFLIVPKKIAIYKMRRDSKM